MHLLPLHTRLIRPGDSVADILRESGDIRAGDILVISSKIIATTENALIDLTTLTPSKEAEAWSKKVGNRTPAFCQAVLDETKRLNGEVLGACPGALLTEVRPNGLSTGTILTANAGIDASNAPEGTVIGWPHDPVASMKKLRESFPKTAIIIGDSCCHPRRLGVTAFALTVSGLDPLVNQKGRNDLFGHALTITTEAVADQLATAANFLMGNAEQSTPAVIIRDHGIPFSDFAGWVPGIEPAEDLFAALRDGPAMSP